jgi:hypothetical protein
MRLVKSIEISNCVQKENIRPTERKEKKKNICAAGGGGVVLHPLAFRQLRLLLE